MDSKSTRRGRLLASWDPPKTLQKCIRDTTSIFHRFCIDFGSHFGDILTILAYFSIDFRRQCRLFLPLLSLRWLASTAIWGRRHDTSTFIRFDTITTNPRAFSTEDFHIAHLLHALRSLFAFNSQAFPVQNQCLATLGLKACFPAGYAFPQLAHFGESQTLQYKE